MLQFGARKTPKFQIQGFALAQQISAFFAKLLILSGFFGILVH
jgi:hypothetical protein